jgi:hypothetical protein
MFNLGRLEHLRALLGAERGLIERVLDDFDSDPEALVRELTLWPVNPSKKPRNVIGIRGNWRRIQRRIYLKLLLPKLRPSRYSHGGVRGRSPLTNARVHRGHKFAFVADISHFYPAISCSRVNRLFLQNACSYEMARALTRLCTFDFHLALGLITSPILANEIFKPIDVRIADACRRMKLAYSRFVDDLTISGKFDLANSGIEGVVRDIVTRNGFALAENKTAYGRLDGELCITGIRLKENHLDASKSFIGELERLIADHVSLADDGPFKGPLLMEGEVFGKAHYACALNPGRRRTILTKLRTIDWCQVLENAVNRELVRLRPKIASRGASRPDCAEELPLVLAARRHRDFCRDNAFDPDEPPF